MNRQKMPAELMARAYRGLILSASVLIRRAEARGVHWNRSSDKQVGELEGRRSRYQERLDFWQNLPSGGVDE